MAMLQFSAALRTNSSSAALTLPALAPHRIGSLPTILLVSVIEPPSFREVLA
ncbi:hypothetical protein ACU4GD_28935 [Cupriavidus basilensis]